MGRKLAERQWVEFKMVNKIVILREDKTQRTWPKKGDVFYFKTNDFKYYFGKVFSNKMSIGPFKNALILCVFDVQYDEIPEKIVLDSSSLLLPPIIADNSCWKKGFFHTIHTEEINETMLSKFLFANPINNKVYGLDDILYEGDVNNMILGERSLCFCDEIIRRVESALND
ncbi:hypothetical protein FI206_22980 [Salmonella enterica subsp. enterica]|nr:hypothetical protein [Salmonella enterica subsp. enterica serovar Hessarek]ECA4736214.1 hypothetical protein [Salmonella enterica subsp. enterica serovar Lerum]EED6909786.1 hypothetical protein [Salmonella enterica subsp. enterica serovar Lerum]